MHTTTEIKQMALGAVDQFIEGMKQYEDPLDVEAEIYTLIRMLERIYHRIHKMNIENVL